MKKTFSFLAFGVLILLPALVIFLVRHHDLTSHTQVMSDSEASPSAWISCAFQLGEEESKEIASIEKAHRAKCAELCEEYFRVQAEVRELASDMNASESELTSASARLSECHLKCQDLSLLHVREIALRLPEDQREDYLAATVPAILGADDSDHAHHH